VIFAGILLLKMRPLVFYFFSHDTWLVMLDNTFEVGWFSIMGPQPPALGPCREHLSPRVGRPACQTSTTGTPCKMDGVWTGKLLLSHS